MLLWKYFWERHKLEHAEIWLFSSSLLTHYYHEKVTVTVYLWAVYLVIFILYLYVMLSNDLKNEPLSIAAKIDVNSHL